MVKNFLNLKNAGSDHNVENKKLVVYMMKNELQNDLVCYWQNGGWHGCNKIVKFNKKFVYYEDYPSDVSIEFTNETSKVRRRSVKDFLNIHDVQLSACGYAEYHKNIGKIVKE